MRIFQMFGDIPSVSAKALSGLPQFILGELGEKGLTKTFAAAGLPMRFLEQRSGYIPQQAAATFIQETSRLLGCDQLGLFLSPFVSIRDYGAWGAYVLSAPSLKISLSRLLKVLPFHSNMDRASVILHGQTVKLSYQVALHDHKSHSIVAHLTLAVLLDLIRQFVGADWRPNKILIDLPKPAWAANVEEHYACPVQFGAEKLTIEFPVSELNATNTIPGVFAKATVQDIVRERASGPPDGLVETVRNIIFQQLIDHESSLGNTGRMLDIGSRGLQRALESEGTSFRKLSNQITMERATELLGLPGESVSSVAIELGYSDHASFSRAFKKETGRRPGLSLCK